MKTITELAREADILTIDHHYLERFATIVRAQALEEAERECYRVGANAFQDDGLDDLYESGINSGSNRCAAAIRQLKETK